MGSGDTKIVFFHRQDHSRYLVYNFYTGQSVLIEMGMKIPDEFILKLPWNISQEIEKALAEWLSKKGVRPDDNAKIEGTLQATRYHLEDLREMLKLKGKREE